MASPHGPGAPAAFDVLVVPHTHWDREWYLPAGRFRQRLVALVDELLDDPTPSPFLLDGQAIVLDDYLAVRPDRRDALAARLRTGVLEAGPWYVLADELIPSGEALVRNLLAGRAALASLGAVAPPVLYCPDSFGHPAALPLLAAGFGCDLVVAWRGYGGARWPSGDAARWRAPDGTTALLAHLPPDGYELGSNLPVGTDAITARWLRLRDVLAPRARLGVLLVHNGADHHARQRDFDDAMEALARVARPDRVRVGGLADFARATVAGASTAELPTVEGELRDSYGYTWTLQGTFATRAAQKRRNAHVERLLLRDVEPWCALAARAGGPRRQPLLDAAWRTLLACHPHDTLCGCSTDEVARAMDARLDDATAQARGLRDDTLLDLAAHDAVDARERRDEWRAVVLVRNAAARARGGVVELDLETFLQDVPVGPGSGGDAARMRAWRGAPVALDGGTVPLQLLARDVRHARTESARHYPDDDLVEVAHAIAWVPPIAGYGIAAFAQETRDATSDAPVAPARAGDRALENGILALAIGPDGRVRLESRGQGLVLDDLMGFEDVGDAGDLYTHSPIGRPLDGAWFRGVRIRHRGPLRASLEALWVLRVPAARRPTDDAPAHAAPMRPARAGRHVEIELRVRFTLDAGAAFLRMAIAGTNLARDHRLRVVLRTGVPGERHLADAAFGPVWRAPRDVPPEDRRAEVPPSTHPMHRWVARFGEAAGVTIVSDGLAEYEARADGAVLVTLVRAVGELSRNDLPERPGHAGWPVPTPEAQSPGRFAARLAVFPHGADAAATRDAIERAADDVLVPLRGATLRSALRRPDATHGIELEGEGLALAAVRTAADGALVLRCVNVTDVAVRGRWRIGVPFAQARRARLDESAVDASPLEVTDAGAWRSVAFEAMPRGVVTLRLEPVEASARV